MTKPLLITWVLFWLLSCSVFATGLEQYIKGRVIDANTHLPLPGVNVLLIGTSPPKGAVTDANGYYVLPAIPLGRHTVQFSFIGYETALFKEIEIRSARPLELNVRLNENFRQISEVTIKPGFRKDRAQNNMAALSARAFSVEETSRFAGGWNDPSRLAGSFAGVTMAEGVNDNAIVIRGNAPKGILWRLEGVEIPAPNHLSGVNNGGGIETAFSVNMLDNSDFFTGAFPAEFGNAMSGVFDINFRNGNNSELETTLQVGSQGVDLSAEGPFSKGGESSFLFNYRYSTFGLIGNLIEGNFGMPAYQDLSYKINLPTTNAGAFSLWGLGGTSSVSFNPDEDPGAWTNTFDNLQYITGSDIAVAGITHQLNTGNGARVRSSIAYSYDRFSMVSNSWQRDLSILPIANHEEDNSRRQANVTITRRFGNRHTNQTGANLNSTRYNLMIYGNPNPSGQDQLVNLANRAGNMQQARFFSQSRWRLTEALDLFPGFNISYFDMNNELVFEPRLSTTWRFMPNHSLSMAYGKHSRPEPSRFYKARDAQNQLLNPNLRVTKAHHWVLGYNFRLSPNSTLKIEGYLQQLFDVPVIENSSYSMINYQWNDYFEDALVNSGTGTNTGVDITLERYMVNDWYYLVTASFFDSKYIGGDGIERNTSFNRNFVINLLSGREWRVGVNNTLGINGKVAYMGGNRFTPPDQELSRANEMVVLDEENAFEWQEYPKLFVDLAVNYKINRPEIAHVISIQGKNLLARKEMFGWAYDFEQQKVVEHGLTMIYPFISWRIEF